MEKDAYFHKSVKNAYKGYASHAPNKNKVRCATLARKRLKANANINRTVLNNGLLKSPI